MTGATRGEELHTFPEYLSSPRFLLLLNIWFSSVLQTAVYLFVILFSVIYAFRFTSLDLRL
jgi:hypothetical protein